MELPLTPPEGIAELEAVVAAAKPNSLLTLPADWVRDLVRYVRDLEQLAPARAGTERPR